jgi:hypothetical protein
MTRERVFLSGGGACRALNLLTEDGDYNYAANSELWISVDFLMS